MPAGYSFRPRAWPLALAFAACAAGVTLGDWQSRRAGEKRALGARLEQVSVRGEFVAGRTVLLDNKTRRGRVGYEVVTPLKLRDLLQRMRQVLEMEKNTGAKIRQNLDIAEFARETGLALQPRVIEQHGGPADGLLREWPRPGAGAEKNAAYALQWYSLAALAVVLAVVLSFRKN